MDAYSYNKMERIFDILKCMRCENYNIANYY